MVILEGRGGHRLLRRAGWEARRFLPLPPGGVPDLLIPLEARAPASYALRRLRPPGGLPKRLRNAALELAIAAGTLPDVLPVQTVGARLARPALLLERAAAFGVPADAAWFLTAGHGDALTRAVLHLFEPGSSKPRWVVKVARVPGYSAPFEQDERGLGLVARAGGPAAARAPRLLGRFEVAGLAASAESAIAGEPLSRTLAGAAGSDRALALIDAVAGWTIEVARTTVTQPVSLEPELRRLRETVLPRWVARGAPADLVDRVEALPGVLAHNDLGTWNVIVDEAQFGAVDWESARHPGLPIWDLLYFLVDAYAILAGARGSAQRLEHALGLLRGADPKSELLFAWLARYVRALSLAPEAVGPLATLCWLHHGLSHVSRQATAQRLGAAGGGLIPPVEQIASHWLQDQSLGVRWPAWPGG
jgi:hypothetical protein